MSRPNVSYDRADCRFVRRIGLLHRLAQPLVLLAVLLVPTAPAHAQTPVPDLTSPEEGGVTFRIARMKTVHDNTFTPDELRIETGGDTFKITPRSGFTDTDSQTGTSVTFTLDDDGKDPKIGVEIELQIVSGNDGDQTFSLTFKKATMMGQEQTTQQKTVTFDFSVNTAINQPTVSTVAPSTLSSASVASASSPLSSLGSDPYLGTGGGCATNPLNCPVEAGLQHLGCGNNFGIVDLVNNTFSGSPPSSGCSSCVTTLGSNGACPASRKDCRIRG